MATIHATDRDGNTRALSAYDGTTLKEVLRDESMGVEAICGGQCACATCHCYIDSEWYERLKPAEDDEIDLLSSCDYYNEAASRLACQILVSKELTGIQVTVAPGE